jgi:Sec-independent protein secretion pathway component TatC
MLGANDRLSLVEHLDELRKRLFRVAFVLLAGVIIGGIKVTQASYWGSQLHQPARKPIHTIGRSTAFS